MLSARWNPAPRTRTSRFAGFSFLALTLSVLACGVPISASEMTATAVNGGTQPSALLSADSQPVGGRQALPASGIAGLTLTPTPRPSVTPAASASITPTATGAAIDSAAAATQTAAPSASKTPTPSIASARATVNHAEQAVKILNDMRVARNLKPLAIDAKLMAGAEAYAKLMADKDVFSHTGPDGSTPQSRLIASGYKGSFKGEALSAGQVSAQAAIESWRDSPSHAVIVFEPTAVDVGIGFYFDPNDFYGTYWVLMAGVP